MTQRRQVSSNDRPKSASIYIRTARISSYHTTLDQFSYLQVSRELELRRLHVLFSFTLLQASTRMSEWRALGRTQRCGVQNYSPLVASPKGSIVLKLGSCWLYLAPQFMLARLHERASGDGRVSYASGARMLWLGGFHIPERFAAEWKSK